MTNLIRLTVWLRGVEVVVGGYIEPADPTAGMMQPELVIMDLTPVVPDPRWRCPGLDELLLSGEYQGISNAYWDTRHGRDDEEYTVFTWGEPQISGTPHARWREFWGVEPLAEDLDPRRGEGPISDNS